MYNSTKNSLKMMPFLIALLGTIWKVLLYLLSLFK